MAIVARSMVGAGRKCSKCGVANEIRARRCMVCGSVLSKYMNQRVRLDGYAFDSKKEANRYLQLLMMQKSGLISKLKVHPKFELCVNGIKIGRFVADFIYSRGLDGIIVEDVKSKPTMTPVYRIKKRLMKALLGVDVREII